MTDFLHRTESILSEAGFDNPEFAQKIALYLEQMCTWNQAHNLTAITEPEEMLRKHILDSLSIAPYIRVGDVLDIGSGAGLPGIPLALHLPSSHFTLLDALSKRIFFLQHIKGLCQIDNMVAVHARIEQFAQKAENQKKYQQITCRAFTSLRDFVADSLPLLADDGMFLAMKGEPTRTEIDELDQWLEQHAPQLAIQPPIPLTVDGLDAHRHLVIIA